MLVRDNYVPWVLYAVSVIHIIWGCALIYRPSIHRLSVMGGIDPWIQLGAPEKPFAVLLILFSILAIITLLNERKLNRAQCLVGLMPQYTIVFIALVSETILLVSAEYDGQHYDRIIIIVSLQPLVTIGIFHTLSILERYFLKWH